MTDQIQFFIDWTMRTNDSISSYFDPLTDVAYGPSRALAKAIGLSETQTLLFVTFQMGFLLSFGYNFITLPKNRKLYSVLTGLFLGFYMHGLGYYVCLIQLSCFYPFLRFLPRSYAMKLAVGLVGSIMVVRNLFPWWNNVLDGTMRVQCTVIFMRVHMLMC